MGYIIVLSIVSVRLPIYRPFYYILNRYHLKRLPALVSVRRTNLLSWKIVTKAAFAIRFVIIEKRVVILNFLSSSFYAFRGLTSVLLEYQGNFLLPTFSVAYHNARRICQGSFYRAKHITFWISFLSLYNYYFIKCM